MGLMQRGGGALLAGDEESPSKKFLGKILDKILWQDKILDLILPRILPKCTKDSWVSCQRSWPRSKIMAAKFLPLAQDSRLSGQDSGLPGQDSCLPGQDSCLPGQDSCLPGQDSCLPGQDSCLPGQDSYSDQTNIKLLSVHVWHELFS